MAIRFMRKDGMMPHEASSMNAGRGPAGNPATGFSGPTPPKSPLPPAAAALMGGAHAMSSPLPAPIPPPAGIGPHVGGNPMEAALPWVLMHLLGQVAQPKNPALPAHHENLPVKGSQLPGTHSKVYTKKLPGTTQTRFTKAPAVGSSPGPTSAESELTGQKQPSGELPHGQGASRVTEGQAITSPDSEAVSRVADAIGREGGSVVDRGAELKTRAQTKQSGLVNPAFRQAQAQKIKQYVLKRPRG